MGVIRLTCSHSLSLCVCMYIRMHACVCVCLYMHPLSLRVYVCVCRRDRFQEAFDHVAEVVDDTYKKLSNNPGAIAQIHLEDSCVRVCDCVMCGGGGEG